MLVRTPSEGYVACCRALAQADLTEAARRLACPTMMVTGSEDGATPPALVEGTARIIPRACCETIAGAGHLPMVETPEEFAALVSPFLREHAHV